MLDWFFRTDYLVLNTRQNDINFINPGVGGFFQGRNPNVPIDVLREKFIDDAIVLYIGKAGGINNRATLQSRIRRYMNFGRGQNAAHYGGRYIWQIREHEELLICWKILKDDKPREIEGQLISEFESHNNRLPFANLQR